MKENVDFFPRVSELWRIRKDLHYMMAYKCTTDDSAHKVLTPWEASLIPFLDGSMNVKDLFGVWKKVFPKIHHEDPRLESLFSQILDDLCNTSGVVIAEGKPSPSLGEDLLSQLVANFAEYQIPYGTLDRPINVNVALTNKCATDCIYCYAERPTCNELDFEQWAKFFSDLATNEIYIVDIAGGDIFTRHDSLKLLEEMVKYDFVFFVSTKCALSRSKTDVLYKLGIGRDDVPIYLRRPLQFSIDSADSITASRLVQRNGYLERIIESVKNSIASGMSPRIKSVLTALNAADPEKVVELFYQYGVRDFQFVQYGRSYFHRNDSLFLSYEQKLELHKINDRLQEKYPDISATIQLDDTIDKANNDSWKQWDDRAICSGGRTSIIIRANGDVSLCDQMPHNSEHTFGNIVESSLAEIWKNPKIQEFNNPPRVNFKHTPCYDCSLFAKCHDNQKGYCYRDALFAYGTIFQAPPHCPIQTKIGLRLI